MICILLTGGMSTPLPFEAYYCDTGLPMETYGEYFADSLSINNCCSDEIEPGVFGAENADEGAWLIVWKSPYTDTPVNTPAECDTTWYDVRGRKIERPGRNTPSGVYLWKCGRETGKVVHVR